MFFGGKKPPPPTIVRKVTVVKKDEAAKPVLTQRSAHSNSSTTIKRLTQKISRTSSHDIVHRSTSSITSTISKPKPPRSHIKPPKQKSLKRKQPSPSVQFPNFSSDEDDSSDDDVLSPKRMRSTSDDSSLFGADDNRQVFRFQSLEEIARDEELFPMIQGSDIVSGDYAKEYKSDVFGPEALTTPVKLQYPGLYSEESLLLVNAKESQGIDPFNELKHSVEMICTYYFSEARSKVLLDDTNGYVRQLIRAQQKGNFPQILSILAEFNETVLQAVTDGTIAKTLDNTHRAPLPLVESILNQVYSRTVSPKVNMLKQYANGTSNVYGELLPRFSHTIFKETQLKSDHVFVDLGSGVGNVALQAALEIGCESWGIEIMPNPAALGRDQVKEFEARCKRWSITHGKVRLVEGDFRESEDIDKALKRADVILVNNQAFEPILNDSILLKVLDLKEGARIVSLKSFVPEGWFIKDSNKNDVRNLLKVRGMEYWTNSVSWTGQGGTYAISTKDSSTVQNFSKPRR